MIKIEYNLIANGKYYKKESHLPCIPQIGSRIDFNNSLILKIINIIYRDGEETVIILLDKDCNFKLNNTTLNLLGFKND